jgi:hypothetical protein
MAAALNALKAVPFSNRLPAALKHEATPQEMVMFFPLQEFAGCLHDVRRYTCLCFSFSHHFFKKKAMPR